MTRELTDSRRAPLSEDEPTSVVVFLNGYGADGADLLGLAEPLAPHMPNTAFRAPNAPERCTASPTGYQWFPIPWIDGSSEAEAATAMTQAAHDLTAYLDRVLTEENLTADRMILVGFSQGTMMSLHVAPRRDHQIAGIVGFSGRLLSPDTLEADLKVKPPVLLLHGDADDVVPFASMAEAETTLKAAGFDVWTHVMPGTPHGIAPDGLQEALGFMSAQLRITG